MTPADLHRVWLVPESFFTVRALREHLEKYPHLGWMVPESGDYIVGGYWKGRPAIGLLMESSPSAHRQELVDRLLASFADSGSELVVLSEREYRRALPFYQDKGFIVLEDVVCYQKPDVRVPDMPRRLAVRNLQESDLPVLVALEEAAFPWLWWETAETFRQVSQRPDTWVLVAYDGSELVGYLILTVRGTFGHLNRIAVHPARQGQGFGRELLVVAIEEMARHGAHTIGLNTQKDNFRSHRLYEGCGFVPTGESFQIYGKWLGTRVSGLGIRESGARVHGEKRSPAG